MAYQILIKATGHNPNLFKFYTENGEVYETDIIEGKGGLVEKYEELLTIYPSSKVKPIHFLNVKMNPSVTETIESIIDIKAIIENNIVTLIAEGQDLSDIESYNWTVVCDGNTSFNLTSIGPRVTMNNVQSSNFIDAELVTATITIGSGNKYFTVKTAGVGE